MADDTSPINGSYVGSDGTLHNLDGGAGLEPCEANRYMSPFYGVFIGSDGQEHGLEEISGGGNSGGGLPTGTTTDAIPEGSDNLYYTQDRVNEQIQSANLAKRSQLLSLTLLASDWSENTQSVYDDTIDIAMNGIVLLAQTVTSDQYTAWTNAQIVITGQDEGMMTFTAFGTVPSVDVQISVILLG
ncbi:hypothetical protein FACS18948_3800 [Clostridia bacterium]|nr:hypothetical protein FACS18948_3800 [Clostridia bacterium]